MRSNQRSEWFFWRRLFEVWMLEELAEYHAEEARLDEVVGFYGKLPDRRRLCEHVHCQVIRPLASQGMVSEELGAEPSPDTLRLYEDALGDYA